MIADGAVQFVFRETVAFCVGDRLAPSLPRPDPFRIGGIEVDGPSRPDDLRHEAEMVGVEMGDEEIRTVEVDSKIVQALLQCGEAFGTVEACIDDEVPVRILDDVRVERLQRTLRQGDFDDVKAGKDLFCCGHGCDTSYLLMARSLTRPPP